MLHHGTQPGGDVLIAFTSGTAPPVAETEVSAEKTKEMWASEQERLPRPGRPCCRLAPLSFRHDLMSLVLSEAAGPRL